MPAMDISAAADLMLRSYMSLVFIATCLFLGRSVVFFVVAFCEFLSIFLNLGLLFSYSAIDVELLNTAYSAAVSALFYTQCLALAWGVYSIEHRRLQQHSRRRSNSNGLNKGIVLNAKVFKGFK
jgi:hypothetical protein